ncbi:Hybrid signal transduction histidine kinase [Actinidia chinensis var. chinensis]|uniref:Hybrid signal transduction histidine kinase n=1 Tax=Actinidia chinensis var. chinensis TaxID=1590841 RepID=A0A2R6RQX3_ACTCC|nr:Hybrid signal transduction histidine kinase [Actinidia chinensis var. chinensis]
MMWIPFGGKAGIIGGGKGGGGTLKTVRRAVRSGGAGGAAQDSFSHSSSSTTTTTNTNRDHQSASNVLSLFSSTDSTPYSPFSSPIYSNSTIATWNSCSSPVGSEGFDWDYVDGSVYDEEIDCYDNPVFGSVPSIDEVQNAVSALRQFPIFAYSLGRDVADEITSPTVPVNKDGTERDWIEPSLQQQTGSRMLQPHGSDRVYDAFHLLQTDPCIQRMVVSVSSDKAVWEAVLDNDVVREIRESLSKVDKSVSEKLDDTSDSSMAATNILIWIFDKTKVKVTELIEKITKLVNELFQPLVDEKATSDTYRFEEKVRASFLLSIVVLLIVVAGRAHKA